MLCPHSSAGVVRWADAGARTACAPGAPSFQRAAAAMKSTIAERRVNFGMRTSLLAQFGSVAVLLQRFGIGQRLRILHRPPVDHVADRQFYDLPALGPRKLSDLHDLRGHEPQRRVRAE